MDPDFETFDLTYELAEGMPTFTAPWHAKVAVTQLGRHGMEGRETRQLQLGTHTGTHIDAPLHFISGGESVDQLDLKKLIGSVSIVDLSFLGEDACVTAELLRGKEITKRTIFRFGWGRHWGGREYFEHYPFFTEEAALFLMQRGVELIGLDTPSPDDSRIPFGSAEDSRIHKLFLGGGIILAEYLAHLNELRDDKGWSLAAVPLKIRGGDGSPARIFLFRTGGMMYGNRGVADPVAGRP